MVLNGTCSFRASQNKLELYGCCEEVDVEVLLLLFCKANADTQPSMTVEFREYFYASSAFKDSLSGWKQLPTKLARDNKFPFSGSFAVVGSESALVDSCSQLRDTNLQISSAVRSLSTALRSSRTHFSSWIIVFQLHFIHDVFATVTSYLYFLKSSVMGMC